MIPDTQIRVWAWVCGGVAAAILVPLITVTLHWYTTKDDTNTTPEAHTYEK
jgi:hypothetical protein